MSGQLYWPIQAHQDINCQLGWIEFEHSLASMPWWRRHKLNCAFVNILELGSGVVIHVRGLCYMWFKHVRLVSMSISFSMWLWWLKLESWNSVELVFVYTFPNARSFYHPTTCQECWIFQWSKENDVESIPIFKITYLLPFNAISYIHVI